MRGATLALSWSSLLFFQAARQDAAKTVEDRLREFGARSDAVWIGRCEKAGLAYPPARVRFLALKAEKRLEVFAAAVDGPWIRLADYPILAASGGPGPKLREGDGQVPEGLYDVPLLNPNSRFHVSLRIGYPNADDVAQGRADGRTKLGGDIMIHGGAASIGCLAMGDPAAEELFTLAARRRPDVLLIPHDFRAGKADPPGQPGWVAARYRSLRALSADLKR
jgi:hypothetical protein